MLSQTNTAYTLFEYNDGKNETYVKLTFDDGGSYYDAAVAALIPHREHGFFQTGIAVGFEMTGTVDEVKHKIGKILRDEVMPKFSGDPTTQDRIRQDIAQIMLGKNSVSQVKATSIVNSL